LTKYYYLYNWNVIKYFLMKAIQAALAAGVIAAASPAEARDCQPGATWYVSGFFSDACVLTLQSPQIPFQMEAGYTRARVNDGIDTGTLRTHGMSATISSVHAEVQKKLDEAIEEIGGSRVTGKIPTVNLQGKVIATATPDVNIGRDLKRNSGEGSPTISLYEATPESMLTAQRRCGDLLNNLPAKAQIGWQEFNVTTNWLTCTWVVKPLDISNWAGPLTKLALELKNKWLVWSDMDDAQILAVKYANNTATLPSNLSKESQDTIRVLSTELQKMRTININGTMQASVMVNKQEYNILNIIGSLVGVAAVFALALWLSRRWWNSSQRTRYAA
jgi:hypothetical protein